MRPLHPLMLLLVVGLLFSSAVLAEEGYTRERSEALMPLIDWQDYSPDAFQQALDEQKPIFLMISAPAWCYWCHVYESEDYLYHPQLYPYLNENFVMVFVDSDKRPDLTRKYLEGGWPSTTIFSPDFRRMEGFSGPRDPLGLLEFFKSVVGFVDERDFSAFAFNITYQETVPIVPTYDYLGSYGDRYLQNLERSFDDEFGGFVVSREPWREGQKFPSPLALLYLLDEYERTGNKKYIDMALTTFRSQYTQQDELESRYRLYDPVEGGFHRYSTNRDWSVPHYEKMLYDQAKFLRAYQSLYLLSEDEEVGTAVRGTADYVLAKLTDPEGGFYSSQDAYLEEEYYGHDAESRAEIEPPFIDETRRIDSNAMMIGAMLYLYDTTGQARYKDAAQDALDFIQERMIGNEGASTYFDYEKDVPGLTGQAISNSWALLAFVNGYVSLEDERYLDTARKIADYSLYNLYDWRSGGFFERNSKDSDNYAPTEQVDLSKPYEENSVFAIGMLRLHTLTKEPAYLEAGVKTLGHLSNRFGSLGATYLFMSATTVLQENDLLAAYDRLKPQIYLLVEERSADFFVDELLSLQQEGVSIDDAPQLQSEFANVGFILLALLALFAGLLSFLSPCCLPVLSAFFAQNIGAKRGTMVRNTLFFFLGLALIFSLFGMGATLIGSVFRDHRLLFTKIAGAVIIIFGIMEVFGKGFSGMHHSIKGDTKTPKGSFIFGILFGVGWSACIGPILASFLLLSATTGTIVKGSALLFIYALGLAIPLLILAFSFDRIKNKRFWKLLKGRTFTIHLADHPYSFHSTYLISGIILILIGILIYNDVLFTLNQYALQTGFVQNIIIGGEEWLKNLFIK